MLKYNVSLIKEKYHQSYLLNADIMSPMQVLPQLAKVLHFWGPDLTDCSIQEHNRIQWTNQMTFLYFPLLRAAQRCSCAPSDALNHVSNCRIQSPATQPPLKANIDRRCAVCPSSSYEDLSTSTFNRREQKPPSLYSLAPPGCHVNVDTRPSSVNKSHDPRYVCRL